MTAKRTLLDVALPAFVYAVVAALFVFPLANAPAIVVSALAAATASIVAQRFFERLRTGAYFLVGILALVLVLSVRAWASSSSSFADLVGVIWAVRTTDLLFFGGGAFAFAFTLRALVLRYRALGALEFLVSTVVVASLVSAHRHGAINRPFELADPFLRAGEDPVVVFYALGALAIALLVLLFSRERSPLRLGYHLLAMSLLLLLFWNAQGGVKIPDPPPAADGLGLRGESGESEQQQQGQGRGGGARPQEDLEFKDEMDSPQSTVPVGVVLFHSDWSPPYGTYYFRQAAFSQFNGRRLIASTMSGTDRDLARSFPTRPTDVEAPPPMGSARAPVETTVAMLTDHPRPFGLEAAVTFVPTRNPDSRRFRRVYRVMSAVLTADFVAMVDARAGHPDWSDAERSHYLAHPEDPRYAELANRIFDELLTPEQREMPAMKVAAISHWLSEHGTYSLRSRHAGAEDPTADMLFGDLTGYCVHFAHASVFLLRASGVPARVGTGYAVSEDTRRGGSALLITGKDSHAWPEAYLEGYGWVVADVSPAQVLTPSPGQSDEDLQRLLGELARGLEGAVPEEDSPIRRATTFWRDLMAALPRWLAFLAGALLVLAYLVKIWRRYAPWMVPERRLGRTAHRAMLDRCNDAGLVRRTAESPESFARRLEAISPAAAKLERHRIAERFGGPRTIDSKETLQLVAAVGRDLRAGTPLRRRLRGAVHPLSYLSSK